ncbi:MAG: DegT/DnrJ/EryC1/StrS aminotransferase family protein [Candidatus Marinimicrobia bacterium]|nr:DegT/DnrJ/EryC1/StrS aminotransferase family protein [Candidatus Neomarinimicrobiota bacterium]MBT5271486.1 DegT/DnrJ/EryC1/StrS aminotransferase family protein [Candidatus Neomarinimicrobiota bacterium]
MSVKNNQFKSWPAYSEEEADAVRDVLLSNKVNYWTGDECRQFEQEFAEWVGAQHAVAVANGTLALEFALKALDIGGNDRDIDEVIVTSRTFLASVSAIVNVGARPVFVDVDSDSQNITAETIEPAITERTLAIICVHLAGWPCDMDPIMALAKQHGLYVIEDCAQAHGARYRGMSVGSIGDVGCWSFCQDKIMTTGGEGGMVTTNSRALWSKLWSYKDHGKSWEAVYEREHSPGFRWLHESFGTNGRMTEMQAAIGRIQLKRMEIWNQARTKNANAIMEGFECYPELFRVPRSPTHSEHAWYKCYIFVKPEGLAKLGLTRDQVIEQFNKAGVPCYQGSCSEVYLEKVFDETTFRPKERLPVAKELGETSLMFLVHPTLTREEMELTCTTINLLGAGLISTFFGCLDSYNKCNVLSGAQPATSAGPEKCAITS